MKLVPFDSIPRKYDLQWDSGRKAILIRVHKDCMDFIQPIPERSIFVSSIQEELGLEDLSDSFSGSLLNPSFGFNDSIQRVGQIGDYVYYRVYLPRIKIENNFVCEQCGGSGKRDPELYHNENCPICKGSGKSHYLDWRSAYIVSASLFLFFDCFEVNNQTSAIERQLVAINMIAKNGQHGSSISGSFGMEVTEYIKSLNPSNLMISNVNKAMRIAHGHMFTFDEYDNDRIYSEINANNVSFTVPGNGCGINAALHECNHLQRGVAFSCHNVDNPLQSLTLVVGITSLTEQIDDILLSARKTLSSAK